MTITPITLMYILWWSGCALMMVSQLLFLRMLAVVNAKLPPEEYISLFWWGTDKASKVKHLYRMFYPNGNLYRIAYRITLIGLTLGVSAAFILFFFIL